MGGMKNDSGVDKAASALTLTGQKQEILELVDALPPNDEWAGLTWRQLGCPNADSAGIEARNAFDRWKDEVSCTVRPVMVLSVTPVLEVRPKALRLAKGCVESASWSLLASLCPQPLWLYAFAVTLGRKSDEMLARAAGSSLVSGLVADAMCSALAEHMAGLAEMEAAKTARDRGLAVSARFSPGYCDWEHSSGQAVLGRVLDFPAAGILLSPKGLMRPRKSVSAALIAAGSIPFSTPCRFCRKNCPHRRDAQPDTIQIQTE